MKTGAMLGMRRAIFQDDLVAAAAFFTTAVSMFGPKMIELPC